MFKPLYGVIGSVLLAAAMWHWVQDVAIAHQQTESAALGIPRGNLSDLYPRWLGARELWLHRRDPYGADITREIQIGYYGRPIDPSRPNDPKDQQGFAYPVYVVFLLAPTLDWPFPVVQRVFIGVLVFLTAASVPWWLEALGWRLSMTARLTWIVLTLGCFPAIQGFKLQQLTLLVAALLALSMCFVSLRRFVWAGILLAIATIKPQLAVLPAVWLCIWVLGNWRERQRLFWSFAASMGVLFVASERLLRGWIHKFGAASAAYYEYTGGGRSVLDVLLTPTWGRIASVLVVAALVALLWRLRRAAEGTADFHWAMALVMATTLIVIPMFAPYNQMLLIPAVMVLVRAIRELWNANRVFRLLVAVTALAVAWPWIAASLLVIALVLLPGPVVQKAWALPIYTSIAIPATVLAMLVAGRSFLRRECADEGEKNPSPVLRQGAASE